MHWNKDRLHNRWGYRMEFTGYKSHPDIDLEKHVDALVKYYRNFNSYGYGVDVETSILYHDWGKMNEAFQARMKGLENGKYMKRDKRKDKHAVLSSMKFVKDQEEWDQESLMHLNMILGHHGTLLNYGQLIDRVYGYSVDEDLVASYQTVEDWDDLGIQSTIMEAEDGWEELRDEQDERKAVQVRTNFSQLVDADRLAAMRKSEFNREDLREERFHGEASMYTKALGYREGNRLDAIRRQVKTDLNEVLKKKKGIFTYTLPTGLGKTIGTARLAEKIDEKMIYVVPYLSISDQTFEVYKDIYQYRNRMGSWDFLVKHDSRLSDQDYEKGMGDKELSVSDLVTSWKSKMVITTTVQFFNSLVGVSSKELRKIHNTYGATILIDEPQAIPYEKWEFLKKVIRNYAEELNWKVIYLSATPPNMEEGVKPLVKNESHIFNQLGRTKIEYKGKTVGFQAIKDWAVEAWSLTKEKDQVLWLLNIERAARKVFKYAHEMVRDRKVVFVSGKLPAIVRSYKIKKIKEMMERGEKVLVISTQVLEAGVDLDFNGVVRDLAPLPVLVQVAGRLNRKWKRERETTYVLQLLGNSVYSDFEFRHTGEVLAQRGNELMEEDYYDACKHYYDLCAEMPPSETPQEWMDHFIYLRKNTFQMIEEQDYQTSAICRNVDDWLWRVSVEDRGEFSEFVKEVTGFSYRSIWDVMNEVSEFEEELEKHRGREDYWESVEMLKGLERYLSWFQSVCSVNDVDVDWVNGKEFRTMQTPYWLLKVERGLEDLHVEITDEDLGVEKKKKEEDQV